MTTIRDSCPLCGGQLALAQVQCQRCHATIAADVAVLGVDPAATATATANEPDLARFGALGRLSRDQLAFVETFIRARGIIKTVEAMLGISYPTVRNRLDDVIATMGLSPTDERASGGARREHREILQDLAEGRITAAEAHALLRRLAPGQSD